MKRAFLFSLFLFVFIFLFPSEVFAAVPLDPIYGQDIETAPTATDYGPVGIQAIIGKIILVVLQIAAVVAIFFILSNAWWLVASGGKSEKIDQYKKGLTWAVGGFVLILLAYSILRFIISIPFKAEEIDVPPPPKFDERGIPTESLENQPGDFPVPSPDADEAPA